jgi:hypothetical protein
VNRRGVDSNKGSANKSHFNFNFNVKFHLEITGARHRPAAPERIRKELHSLRELDGTCTPVTFSRWCCEGSAQLGDPRFTAQVMANWQCAKRKSEASLRMVMGGHLVVVHSPSCFSFT